MKLTIDTERQQLIREDNGEQAETHPLYSAEAFEILSQEWLKVGWVVKYPYTFTWFGRPIVQLPEDMIRIQETIYRVRPDVIVETGVAHGGSLVYYATLCKAMGTGRVIGIDIEIRPHNRTAIETHELAHLITLVEGSSTDPGVVDEVKSHVRPDERVLVILDSCHTSEHVLEELRAYSGLVSKDSYIVATDGIMASVSGLPRTDSDWSWNNPEQAALEFARQHPEFTIEDPPMLFNESPLTKGVTHWPSAYLKRTGETA